MVKNYMRLLIYPWLEITIIVVKNTLQLINAKKKEFDAFLNGEVVSCEGDRNSILEQVIEQMEQDKSILTDEELRDEIYTIYLAVSSFIVNCPKITVEFWEIKSPVENVAF